MSGIVSSLLGGTLRLIYLTAAGILVGLAIGFVSQWIDSHIDNARIEITLSMVTPHLAYSLAEAVDSSGVLASVACGLYLGHMRSLGFSPRVRVESRSFWTTRFSFAVQTQAPTTRSVRVLYSCTVPSRVQFAATPICTMPDTSCPLLPASGLSSPETASLFWRH